MAAPPRVFTLFDLPVLELSPRTRDWQDHLPDHSHVPCRVRVPAWPDRCCRRANLELIAGTGTICSGWPGRRGARAPAPLLVGELSAPGGGTRSRGGTEGIRGPVQNGLRRPLLADPAYRRKISRQLNKGELVTK